MYILKISFLYTSSKIWLLFAKSGLSRRNSGFILLALTTLQPSSLVHFNALMYDRIPAKKKITYDSENLFSIITQPFFYNPWKCWLEWINEEITNRTLGFTPALVIEYLQSDAPIQTKRSTLIECTYFLVHTWLMVFVTNWEFTRKVHKRQDVIHVDSCIQD